MTIRDIAIAFGFKVDEQSAKKVEQKVSDLKGFAKKALGAIGIGFSLVKVNQLIEDFTLVNQKIKTATQGLKDQEKATEEIEKAARASNSSYEDTANVVTGLLNSQNRLFNSVEKTTQFAELMNKAFRGAGLSAQETASLSSSLTSAFSTGKVSASQFQQLMTKTPQVVTYLSNSLGISERQVKALGTAGKITANQLYTALNKSASAIEKQYGETSLTISDALRLIRSEFGQWLYQLNDSFQITQRIAKLILNVFTRVMSVLRKITTAAEQLAKRLGGVENLLKLIGIVGGSLLAVMKSKEIIAFLKSAKALIAGVSAKAIAVVGIVILIALAIEDLINFLQGNESVFEEFFGSIGLNAEEMRAQMLEAFNRVKDAFSNLWQVLKGTLSEIWTALKPVLKQLVELLMNIISQILPVLCDLIETVAGIVSEIVSTVLPPLIEFISTILSYVIDFINDILPVLMDLIKSLLPIIKQIVDAILPALVSIIKAILPIIQEIISKILPVIAELLKKIIPLVVQIVEKILPILCNLIEKIVPILVEIINKILPIITKLLERLLPIIMQIVDKVLPFIVKILDAIMPILQTIIDAILPILINLLNVLSPILDLICDLLGPIFNLISAILKPILSILDVLQPIISALLSLVNTILKPIISLIQTLSNLLTGVFGTAIKTVSKILEPLLNILSKVFDFISKIVEFIGGGISNVTSKISDWAGGVVSTVGNAVSGAVEKVGGWVQDTAQKVGNWVGEKAQTVGNAVSTAANWVGEKASAVGGAIAGGAKKAWGWVKGLFGAAQGGYVEPNNPMPIIVGDNTQEGEIISPISKMKQTVLDALATFSNMGTRFPQTAGVLTGSASNRSIVQNVEIRNNFECDSKNMQQQASNAMSKTTKDTSDRLAHALAYAR